MAKSSHTFMLGMGKNKNSRHVSRIMLLVAVMGLTLVCTGCGKSKEKTSEVSDNSQEVTMSADTAIVTPPDGMETTTNQDIINLITLYYNALKDGDSATVSTVKKDVSEEEKIRLETRAADIESYDTVKQNLSGLIPRLPAYRQHM